MIDKKDAGSFFEDYLGLLSECIRYISGLLRKYIVSVLVITLLCTGIGIAYWYSIKPYYEAGMVCGYNNARLARKNYGEMFQKLDVLAKSGSYNALSQVLELPVALTSRLTGFEARNMLGSPLQEDITGTYQSLYFTVKATDRNVFAPLQPALIHYLSNGPYQRDIGVIEIAKLDHRIQGLQREMDMADSAIAAYTASLKNGNKADSSVVVGISALLMSRDQLQEKKAALEQKKALEESASVMVIHGFTPGDKPGRGSKKLIFGACIIGLFIGCCQALWREAKYKN